MIKELFNNNVCIRKHFVKKKASNHLNPQWCSIPPFVVRLYHHQVNTLGLAIKGHKEWPTCVIGSSQLVMCTWGTGGDSWDCCCCCEGVEFCCWGVSGGEKWPGWSGCGWELGGRGLAFTDWLGEPVGEPSCGLWGLWEELWGRPALVAWRCWWRPLKYVGECRGETGLG